MRLPRQPFSWDDEDERPIPLSEPSGDSAEARSSRILEEAERLVRDAQDGLARQDTDPLIRIPPKPSGVAAPALATSIERAQEALMTRLLSRHAGAVLLALSCVVAFGHGWSVGSSSGETRLGFL